MGKYDALMKYGATEDTAEDTVPDKYASLMKYSATDESEGAEDEPVEKNTLPSREEQLAYLASRKPSEVAGDIVKGLSKTLTRSLPDVPYIAKTGWETVKGLAGASGQLLNKKNYANVIDHPVQAAKGAAKGLGNTALGIGASIAADAPALRQIKHDLTGDANINYTPPNSLQPKTEAEQSGSNLASSGLAIGTTLLSAKPIAKAGFKAISNPTTAKTLKDLGNRGQNITTKILTKEADSGAKIENIGKHGLFGSEDVALKKGKSIVDDTYQQLKSVIEEESNPGNYKSLNSVIDEAQTRALSTAKNDRGAIVAAFKRIKEDYLGSKDVSGFFKDDNIDLSDAQMLKQDAAARGEWHHLPFNATADNAKGVAYKSISNVLREHLENAGGPKVKELNRKMSEIIPINTANAKRYLVNSRKNPIPLDDFVGYLTSAASFAHGNPLPAVLTIGNKVIKSPKFAEKLYNLGDKMEKNLPAPQKPPTERRTIAELPSDWNIAAYQRKGTPIIEKGNRLISEKDQIANLKRDFDVIDPTTIDKLDRWDIKGKPIEGIDRSTSKVIDPTTINRIGLDENELLQLKKLASLR